MTKNMERKKEFLDKTLELNSKYDINLIEKAYNIAEKQHKGQLRKSGEPYIIHPVATAMILAELGMDEDVVVAGLLHDVVEDTDYTKEDLLEDFGESICLLVDGVTKLGSIKFESKEDLQAENLRKMFLAMSKDIRVLIIKLADRLHNMRTIDYMTPEKIQEKCRETLDIYAPLASRLGIYGIKFELEDIALKHTDYEAYQQLRENVSEKRDERQKHIDHVIAEIEDALDEMGIEHDIKGRSKHFYSIYKKMLYQNKQLDEIFDLIGIRIIVENVKNCYAVLGIVHTMWKPIPGRFKDYIAMPKPNMYQSLHTTVIGDSGKPFEIQIRTYEMDRIAEYGIAAHWKYKEGIKSDKEEVKLAWLRQTIELQKDMKDPKEFMETLRVDLFASQVFVFTPQGDVLELPKGSTPLDFAYKIHSDIGHKCVGARVNGKMVTIDHVLDNGDQVEIVTSSNSKGPSIDWLNIAKSSGARSKIRGWLKKQNSSDAIEKGKDVIDKYVRRKGYTPQDVLKSTFINRAVKELGFNSSDEMYNQLSYGGVLTGKVANVLFKYYREEKKIEEEKLENTEDNLINKEKKNRGYNKYSNRDVGISIEGIDNLLIRVAKCCNPVPGDDIVGYITKGRGVTVHRRDCENITAVPVAEKNRLIDVSWNSDKLNSSYDSDIMIIAENEKGLFSTLSKTCEDLDAHINGVNTTKNKDETINITLTLSITDTEQINKIIRTLKNVPEIIDVYRARA